MEDGVRSPSPSTSITTSSTQLRLQTTNSFDHRFRPTRSRNPDFTIRCCLRRRLRTDRSVRLRPTKNQPIAHNTRLVWGSILRSRRSTHRLSRSRSSSSRSRPTRGADAGLPISNRRRFRGSARSYRSRSSAGSRQSLPSRRRTSLDVA